MGIFDSINDFVEQMKSRFSKKEDITMENDTADNVGDPFAQPADLTQQNNVMANNTQADPFTMNNSLTNPTTPINSLPFSLTQTMNNQLGTNEQFQSQPMQQNELQVILAKLEAIEAYLKSIDNRLTAIEMLLRQRFNSPYY